MWMEMWVDGLGVTHRLKAYATTRWLALLLFCLAGLSPKLAAATGIQLSVPLMFAFLWANKKAADVNVSGFRQIGADKPEVSPIPA
jgi:hypothetical protein